MYFHQSADGTPRTLDAKVPMTASVISARSIAGYRRPSHFRQKQPEVWRLA